jgi:uncharacterized OB-fold protein
VTEDLPHVTARAARPLVAAFFSFLEKREFRILLDRTSGQFIDFAELCRCPADGDWDWVKASGHATLYSYAVYRRQYQEDFPPPYNVAAVVLKEGPFLIATVAADAQRLAVDMPLLASFDQTGRLIFMPSK